MHQTDQKLARILAFQPGGSAEGGPHRIRNRPLSQLIDPEFDAMNGHPILVHSVVNARNVELRVEAERARFFNEVRRVNGVPSAVSVVRRLVGNAMVRAGQRIEGRVAQPKAGERIAGAPVLRVAR